MFANSAIIVFGALRVKTIVEYANTVDTDEMARNELSHLDIEC